MICRTCRGGRRAGAGLLARLVNLAPRRRLDRPRTLTLRTAFPVGSSAPHYAIDHFEKQPRYALEGSPALIDAPGEGRWTAAIWCIEPREGETPDSLDATVPRLRQLVEIAPGADGAAPADIRFEGIAFAHCRWDTLTEGYASGQATKHDRRDGSGKGGQTFIPAAVRVAGASKIAFQNCRFAHLGGSGVWIGQGASDCRIDGGAFADISGNAINIGEQGTENVARNIAVDGATVAGCGAQFFGSVGIWIGMAEGCAVERCEIRDLPYTGVSVGWRWDPTPSPCRGHRIAGNHIHHVMQVLSDGGGIYTLGRQPGTVLANNHIHDVPLNAGRAQSNGIFMDEGTTDLTVEGNLIHAIAKSPIRFHKAGENSIRRNTLGVGEGATAFTYNNTDPDRIRFEANRELPEGAPELSNAADAWAP
ncbi:MAG: right-handed parallel beta-helix repeat-containing protein [Verrucomicrobiales bacterium]